MNFINEVAISSCPEEFDRAVEFQHQLNLDNISSCLLPEYKMEEDDEPEDMIDARYNLLRKVGAEALVVITKEICVDDCLPYPLMADIEAAAELREEGLYQKIHTRYPLEHYGESAVILQKLDVKPITGNKYARMLTDKEIK